MREEQRGDNCGDAYESAETKKLFTGGAIALLGLIAQLLNEAEVVVSRLFLAQAFEVVPRVPLGHLLRVRPGPLRAHGALGCLLIQGIQAQMGQGIQRHRQGRESRPSIGQLSRQWRRGGKSSGFEKGSPRLIKSSSRSKIPATRGSWGGQGGADQAPKKGRGGGAENQRHCTWSFKTHQREIAQRSSKWTLNVEEIRKSRTDVPAQYNLKIRKFPGTSGTVVSIAYSFDP